MQGLRRNSDTRKATDSLGKLHIANRSVQLISSGADDDEGRLTVTDTARTAETIADGTKTPARRIADAAAPDSRRGRGGRAAEKTAGVTKSAAAATRRAALAGETVRAEGDSSEQAAKGAHDLFSHATQRTAQSTARGTAKVVRGGTSLTRKTVKNGIVAAQRRGAALKVAEGAKTTAKSGVTVSRAGAAIARAGAAATATVKSMVAAVAAAVTSTPVIGIIVGVLAAILAVLSLLSWLPGMTSADDPEYGNGGDYPVGVAPGPWGGHENGRIPEDLLASIPWASDYSLREDATVALTALNEKYKAEFGHDLIVNDAYRDYAGQQAARDDWCAQGRCENAAVPGTSNHGWALAADLGLGSFGSTGYSWMKTNGPKYGWQHPSWAEPGGSAPEPWHWDFWGWEGSGNGGDGGDDAVPDGAAQTYAKLKLGDVFGLMPDPAAQFTCLQTLWTNESGWDHTAENPTSGAYGIPQALPGSKMATHGDDWRTNYKTQIDWGLDYIRDRYNTPCEAWTFWQNQTPSHWY